MAIQKAMSSSELRQLAEESLQHRFAPSDSLLSSLDTQRLLHELQVHQIELEMQNEELRCSRMEVEDLLERYTDLYDFAPVAYFTLGPDSSIIKTNLAGSSLLGMDRDLLAGKRFAAFVDQSCLPAFNGFFEQSSACEDRQSCELQLDIDDVVSSPRVVRLDGAFYHAQQEYRVVVVDITESKRAEEQIRHLLNEKELVLREVHHRVKNNMSTIVALLRLQKDANSNPAVQSALQDAATRVHGMMVLYEKLFHSEHTGRIPIQDYFPALINEIIRLFPQQGSIRIETNFEDLTLSSSWLTPMGIIINELITNSMKYAFCNRDEGLIRIGAAMKGKLLEIQCEDDGIGLPDAFIPADSSGFGFQLINMLVEQLHGTITIEGKKGTKISIAFEP